MGKSSLNIHAIADTIKKSVIIDSYNLWDESLEEIIKKYSKILIFIFSFDVDVLPQDLCKIDAAFGMGAAFVKDNNNNNNNVQYCILQNGSRSPEMLIGCAWHPIGLKNAELIQSLMQTYPERVEVCENNISLLILSEITES